MTILVAIQKSLQRSYFAKQMKGKIKFKYKELKSPLVTVNFVLVVGGWMIFFFLPMKES